MDRYPRPPPPAGGRATPPGVLLSGLIAGAMALATLAVVGWLWGELLFWRIGPGTAVPRQARSDAPAKAPSFAVSRPSATAARIGGETERGAPSASRPDPIKPAAVNAKAAEAMPVPARGPVIGPPPLPSPPSGASVAVDPFGESGPTLVVLPGPPAAKPPPPPVPRASPPAPPLEDSDDRLVVR